jgi:hypothetical protein
MSTAPIPGRFLSARDENSETKTRQIRISTALGMHYISQCYFVLTPHSDWILPIDIKNNKDSCDFGKYSLDFYI